MAEQPDSTPAENSPGTFVLTLTVEPGAVALKRVRGALEAFLGDLELFQETTGDWRNRGNLQVNITAGPWGTVTFEEQA